MPASHDSFAHLHKEPTVTTTTGTACSHTFPYWSVIPPSHCPRCGQCLHPAHTQPWQPYQPWPYMQPWRPAPPFGWPYVTSTTSTILNTNSAQATA